MNRPRKSLVVSLLASSGVLMAAAGFSANGVVNQPLFTNLDQFVLVAEESIHLADKTQISSGDLASNGKVFVSGENIVNGNLFADEVRIAGGTTIYGSASYNKLHLADTAEILGELLTPISLPIVQLPDTPEIQPEGDDVIVENEQTLNPGNYSKIEVKENAKLTLVPGEYGLNELILRNNSKLIYSDTTTVNIKRSLNIQNNVLIAPDNINLEPIALTINFSPETKSPGKSKEPKVAGPNVITIGDESFVSLKLVAPNSKVVLGKRTTIRGQVIAGTIQVGEENILSRGILIAKEGNPEDVEIDTDGSQFLVNEIIINFTDGGTFLDAQTLADIVDGRITGFVGSTNVYQVEILTTDIGELETKIQMIKQLNHPLVEGVFRNYVLDISQ